MMPMQTIHALQNAWTAKTDRMVYSMTADLLSVLKDLFVNRSDCYCIQLKQGYSKISEPLTDEILQQHLDGKHTVGSYQLDLNNLVKWLCLDIDPEKNIAPDPKATAKKILRILQHKTTNSNRSIGGFKWQ
jgi:hypothetical protein